MKTIIREKKKSTLHMYISVAIFLMSKAAGSPIIPTALETVNTINNDDICLEPDCVHAASSMLKKMNVSADPCEDFFEFSCGTMMKERIIPDEKSSITLFSDINEELQEKLRKLVEANVTEKDSKSTVMVKNLFQSCMDSDKLKADGLEPLKQLLKKQGGWPVVEGESWDEANFTWINYNYRSRSLGFSVDNLFDFSVTTDVKNSSWRMIWFDQPSLGMSREYLIKGLNDSDVQAYLKYSIDVAVLLGADRNLAEKEMKEVLDFQIKLANISLPREERRNVTKLYNTMSLDELQEKITTIPWVEYTNSILDNFIKVDGSERIGVSDIKYFINLEKILENTTNRVISNYLLWRMTAASAGYLSQDIRDIQFEFSKKLTGKTERQKRWKECIGLVSGSLSYAISNLYVKHHFKEDAKNKADELVNYILSEFKVFLNEIDWMDNDTKIAAKEKADTIRPQIGYPQELLVDENLDEHYKNLTITRGTLLDIIRELGIFRTDYSFRRLREKVDKLDWKRQASVAIVNAFYSAIENSIKFPAGILQGHFFNPKRPSYLNFGAIGFVIGHEITHGFDDQGKQFDKDGNLFNWWNKATEQKFLKKAKCIIEQYGNYTAPENGMNLNGINTQGENIADNGGIKEAYYAYQKWTKKHKVEPKLPGLNYSPNQLFWLSAGQVWCSKYRAQSLKIRILTGVHSPGRFRVNGPFQNSEDFARDWQCKLGSPMNPKDKCVVW